MKLLLAIAAGGALGALGRHFVGLAALHTVGATFPWGTLAVNVIGSFAIGGIIETAALVWSPSLHLRAFLTVGVLGSFTTFSTFSVDVALLYQRGQIGLAAAYILASVILSIGALFAAMSLIRQAVA